jgi:hypothetical protein
MTISHTWSVAFLEFADADGLASVVNRVNWVCSSDDGNGHSRVKPGSTSLNSPDPASYTAYVDIIEADVIAWLDDSVTAEAEAQNEAAIQRLIDAEASNAGFGVPW